MGGSESSLQEEPEPGDLIEIFREFYNHWVLYAGDGNVIHLTVPDGVTGVSSSSVPLAGAQMGLVKKEPLSKVVEGCTKYRISKKYDEKYNRRPRKEILRDAEAMVGKWVKYDLFSNNCEHFATGLCHGVRKSKQAEDGLLAGTIVGAGAALITLAGLALAVTDTPKAENRQRRK